MMKLSKIFIFLSSLSIMLAVVFGILLFKMETKKNALPVLGHIADFTLYDTNKKEFGLSELKGKVWIACFFFTTCSDICPIMIKNMTVLNQSFSTVKDVQLVSVTVNPEQDSVNVLAEYAKKNNLNEDKWHFLTGSREKITDLVVKSFKLGSVEEPIFHSSYLVLVDKEQNLRGYYEGTVKESMVTIIKDVKRILKER